MSGTSRWAGSIRSSWAGPLESSCWNIPFKSEPRPSQSFWTVKLVLGPHFRVIDKSQSFRVLELVQCIWVVDAGLISFNHKAWLIHSSHSAWSRSKPSSGTSPLESLSWVNPFGLPSYSSQVEPIRLSRRGDSILTSCRVGSSRLTRRDWFNLSKPSNRFNSSKSSSSLFFNFYNNLLITYTTIGKYTCFIIKCNAVHIT